MAPVLRPTLTPHRRAWLDWLVTHGVSAPGMSRPAQDCLALGWTEHISGGLIAITDAGRAVLSEDRGRK